MMNQPKFMRRFPSFADAIVMLLLFFVAQFVASLLLRCFGVVVPEALPYNTTDIEDYTVREVARGEAIAIAYPLSMLLSLALLWGYVRLRGGKGLHIRHSVAGLNPNIILLGVVWVLSAQVVLEPLVTLLPSYDATGVGRGFWACVTACVSAPVLEELLFRGVILESVRRGWGAVVAVVVSALLFGLIHVQPATVVVGVVAGLIFGLMYLRTSSLFSTIIIHSVNNAIALMLIHIGAGGKPLSEVVGGGRPYYIIYGVAVLLFVAISVDSCSRLIIRHKRSKKNE